jgi:hypothetical protein
MYLCMLYYLYINGIPINIIYPLLIETLMDIPITSVLMEY